MKPSEASVDNPIRLTGEMTWLHHTGVSQSAPIERALIRGENDIVVESKWQGDYYTAPLRSSDGIHFTADFVSAPKKRGVTVSCKLWSNKSGFLLFGTWVEGGEQMHWIVELCEPRR